MDTQPGDIVLTHGHSLIHKGIRFAQNIRFRGERRRFAYWNHAAVVVGKHGEIIEAQARYGVRKASLAVEYADLHYDVVDVKQTQADRDEIVAFAESCLGQDYGFLTIISLMMWTSFGGKFIFGLDGTEICSGLAAQAQVRGTANFPRMPSMMMPADLAEYYEVERAPLSRSDP